MNKFLVFLEQREGVVKKTSIDVWLRLQAFAAVHEGSTVAGILAGPVDLSQYADLHSGTGRIYHACDEQFRFYNPEYYARLVTRVMELEGCTTLFFADSVLSRDLSPKLSVRLQASLLSGCFMSDVAEACATCTRPVYSGSAIASVAAGRPLQIFILVSSIQSFRSSCHTHPVVIELELNDISNEPLFPVIRNIVMHSGKPDVAEAGIIVAGGRGMGGSDGFVLLEELALLLGGAVGASRQAVDERWRSYSEQIGQTGKTVAPALYIACGISGAVQHLAGIRSAGTVVAVNSDPHASIFDVADYGIVGDVHCVLPRLMYELKEFLKKK